MSPPRVSLSDEIIAIIITRSQADQHYDSVVVEHIATDLQRLRTRHEALKVAARWLVEAFDGPGSVSDRDRVEAVAGLRATLEDQPEKESTK